MSDKLEVKSDLKLLNTFIMSLTAGNGMSIKVGILAGKNMRDDKGGETNASIGAKHEFGSMSERIPKRSFLKMPLQAKAGELTKSVMQWAIPTLVKDGVEPLLKKIGSAAEGIVHEAFDTGGFGTWQKLSKRTIDKKKHDRILIETSQLQRAITSQVVKGGA